MKKRMNFSSWDYHFKFYVKFLIFNFLTPRVDFIKVGRTAQIIEIVLSKLGAQLKLRSTPLKSFSKVERRAQNSL